MNMATRAARAREMARVHMRVLTERYGHNAAALRAAYLAATLRWSPRNFNQLLAEERRLKAKVAALVSKFGPNHPRVRALQTLLQGMTMRADFLARTNPWLVSRPQ